MHNGFRLLKLGFRFVKVIVVESDIRIILCWLIEKFRYDDFKHIML